MDPWRASAAEPLRMRGRYLCQLSFLAFAVEASRAASVAMPDLETEGGIVSALLDFVQTGSFPQSEAVASAKVSNDALPQIVQELTTARGSVRVVFSNLQYSTARTDDVLGQDPWNQSRCCVWSRRLDRRGYTIATRHCSIQGNFSRDCGKG